MTAARGCGIMQAGKPGIFGTRPDREETIPMKRFLSALLILLLIPAFGNAAGLFSGLFSEGKTVGTDIVFEDIEDFYYTFDASYYPPFYQRYRFYIEGNQYFFFHETREGGGWPQTEEDITESGTLELTEEQWHVFCGLLYGGAAERRTESLNDGDAGPWMYIYWIGGEAEGREFRFESRGKEAEFESFCESLKEQAPETGRLPDAEVPA